MYESKLSFFKYNALLCYVEHLVYEDFYIIKQCLHNKFKV